MKNVKNMVMVMTLSWVCSGYSGQQLTPISDDLFNESLWPKETTQDFIYEKHEKVEPFDPLVFSTIKQQFDTNGWNSREGTHKFIPAEKNGYDGQIWTKITLNKNFFNTGITRTVTTIAVADNKIKTTIELWITKNVWYSLPDWLVKLASLSLFMKIPFGSVAQMACTQLGFSSVGHMAYSGGGDINASPIIWLTLAMDQAIGRSQSLIYATYKLIQTPLDFIFSSDGGKLIENNGINFGRSLYGVATDPILAPVIIGSLGYYAWLQYTKKQKTDDELNQTEQIAS